MGFDEEWVREVTRFAQEKVYENNYAYGEGKQTTIPSSYAKLDVILSRRGGIRPPEKACVKWIQQSEEPGDYLSDHSVILFNLMEEKNRALNIQASPKHAIFLNAPFELGQTVTLEITNHGEGFDFSLESPHLQWIYVGDCGHTDRMLSVSKNSTKYLKLTFKVAATTSVERKMDHLTPAGTHWLILTQKGTGEQYHWRVLFNNETEASLAL
ncbi:unnamed protein product, partial [Mesorhabditis spiculigera]